MEIDTSSINLASTNPTTNSMINKEAFARIKLCTCAIGVLKVSVEDYANSLYEPQFRIFGTGLLIGPRLAITNRHVIQELTKFLEKESLPKDRRRIAFFRSNGTDFQQAFHEFEKVVVTTDPKNFDIGLILFKAPSDDPILATTPIDTQGAFACEVGDPIGVYGYAYGENLLKREVNNEDLIYRMGPILQQGFISAISPFDHAQQVDRLLLDVRTARGMSGAPVFDPRSGIVYGLHSAGIGNEGIVAFAIPISSSMVASFIEMVKNAELDQQGTTQLNVVSRPNKSDS